MEVDSSVSRTESSARGGCGQDLANENPLPRKTRVEFRASYSGQSTFYNSPSIKLIRRIEHGVKQDMVPFLDVALDCARRQIARLKGFQPPSTEPEVPLTPCHVDVGVELATQTRRASVDKLVAAIMKAVHGGSHKENRPFLTLSSLPRQGKSLELDIARRRLLRSGVLATAAVNRAPSSCPPAAVRNSSSATPHRGALFFSPTPVRSIPHRDVLALSTTHVRQGIHPGSGQHINRRALVLGFEAQERT